MRKVKYLTLFLVIFGGLFFLFGPEVIPENFQSQELPDLISQNDVIIIFNSGGWGNTPINQAEDFAPIIEGIEETLKDWGYNSLVLPYSRTKDTLLGGIAGTRDFLNSFKSSSEVLAEKVEFLSEKFPDKKIILAGLSSGGALVDEAMEKISAKSEVLAITAGIPFWHQSFKSESTLLLDNRGRDTLARGDIKPLILALIKAPFKWIASKISGQNLTFSQAVRAPGHDYLWSSPEVGSQITTFLKEKF